MRDDVLASSGAVEQAETARRAAALARLDAAAGRSPIDAAFLTTVLELVADDADVVAARRAQLPAAEQAIWESVGARFGDWEAVARTRARTAVSHAEMVRDSIDGDAAVAELLGVDRSRISQRVTQRSLYAFTGPSGRRLYPRWQFRDDETLPGLRTVLEALPADLHPLVVRGWFTSPDVDLDLDGDALSPVDWLATGGDPAVAADLASDVGLAP